MGTAPPSVSTILPPELYTARLKANDFVQEHLKTIVTVASGTLVLTVSFVKDVIGPGTPDASLTWLLAVSWAALGLAVFCATFGLATLVNNLDDADLDLDKSGIPKAFAAGKQGVVLRWEVPSIFFFGLGIVALALFGALNYHLFLQRKPETKPSVQSEKVNHFTIVPTPEHQAGSKRRDSHVFLLDQNTGEVWQMVCSANRTVSFKRVTVEGLNASPSR